MRKIPLHFDARDPEQMTRQVEKLYKLSVESDAQDFEKHRVDAWYHLLMGAVTRDTLIPERTKEQLCRLLIQMQNGERSIDPLSIEKRSKEKLNKDIYGAMMRTGDNLKNAKKKVAKDFGLSESTVLRKYNDHIKRWPDCKRIDGRKQKNRA